MRSLWSQQAPRAEALKEALGLAEKAVSLDGSSKTMLILGMVYAFLQNPEKAQQAAEQAIAISPNNAIAYDCMGAR